MIKLQTLWHVLPHEKKLILILLTLFVCKSFIAFFLPLTGDEAYFYLWSQHLSPTFYDHPPVIGWVLAFIESIFSDQLIILRLLAITTPLIIAWLLFRFFSSENPLKSYYFAVVIAFTPFDILHLLITNDTTLLLLSFLSLLSYLYALEYSRIRYAILAGVAFGFAFLSKYLAIILALSLIIATIRSSFVQRYKILFITALCALPFALFNLWANAHNCWSNIVFNLSRGTESTPFNPLSFPIYTVYLVYLLTPSVIYFAIKHRSYFITLHPRYKFLASLSFINILFFALLSLKKNIGLHWLLFIIPPIFMFLFALIPTDSWKKIVKHTFYIGFSHLVILTIILAIPYSIIAKTSFYQKHIHYLYPQHINTLITPYKSSTHFATTSYSASAYLYYHTHTYFSVFGGGSRHGREDDRITDYAKLDHQSFAILSPKNDNLTPYTQYFRSFRINNYPIAQGQISILWGKDFNYPLYQKQVLQPIMQEYYKKPSFLPSYPCFWDKYHIKECQ